MTRFSLVTFWRPVLTVEVGKAVLSLPVRDTGWGRPWSPGQERPLLDFGCAAVTGLDRGRNSLEVAANRPVSLTTKCCWLRQWVEQHLPVRWRTIRHHLPVLNPVVPKTFRPGYIKTWKLKIIHFTRIVVNCLGGIPEEWAGRKDADARRDPSGDDSDAR